MRIKIVFIFLFLSLNIFSYILPYFEQQHIYFKETTKSKSYNHISFRANNDDYTINKATINSENPLVYVLSNLFIYHEKSLINFLKKHHIDSSKKYYTLYNDIPTVVYGNNVKNNTPDIDNLKPEIWLNNENAYPVKVVFKLNNNIIIAEFPEFNNQKYKYMFPSKVIITINGTRNIYQLKTFK